MSINWIGNANIVGRKQQFRYNTLGADVGQFLAYWNEHDEQLLVTCIANTTIGVFNFNVGDEILNVPNRQLDPQAAEKRQILKRLFEIKTNTTPIAGVTAIEYYATIDITGRKYKFEYNASTGIPKFEVYFNEHKPEMFIWCISNVTINNKDYVDGDLIWYLESHLKDPQLGQRTDLLDEIMGLITGEDPL